MNWNVILGVVLLTVGVGSIVGIPAWDKLGATWQVYLTVPFMIVCAILALYFLGRATKKEVESG